MWEWIYLFITIFITMYFVLYKYSKGIRVIAYKEMESPGEAVLSFVALIVLSALWAFYFVKF